MRLPISRSSSSRSRPWWIWRRRSLPDRRLSMMMWTRTWRHGFGQTKGNYAGAGAAADRIIRCRFRYSHGIASPIETRGVVAHWDGRAHRLTVWDSTQAPVFIRNGLAGMLGLSERQVRVIAPFVGGGFGPKIMMFYPEEVLIPWAAMQVGRPIKWIEDRREHFFATSHE